MKGNILNFKTESVIPKFRFAKVGASDNSVALAGAGEATLGVSLDVDSPTNSRCDLQLDGIHMLELGGTVSYGDKVASDATGRGVTSSAGVSSSAIALDSGVAGDYVRIKIETNYIPASEPDPAPVTHTVTLPTGVGYTASFEEGSSSPVADGGSVSFTVTPELTHEIVSVTDGTDPLTPVSEVYTITNITADITVVVTTNEL